jgi:exodeoxyribonuclease VII small subunit
MEREADYEREAGNELEPGNEREASYEQNIEKLTDLITRLQTGGLTLKQVLSCFEECVGLVGTCEAQLERASEQLRILSGDNAAESP